MFSTTQPHKKKVKNFFGDHFISMHFEAKVVVLEIISKNVISEYMIKKYGIMMDFKPLSSIIKTDQLYYYKF